MNNSPRINSYEKFVAAANAELNADIKSLSDEVTNVLKKVMKLNTPREKIIALRSNEGTFSGLGHEVCCLAMDVIQEDKNLQAYLENQQKHERPDAWRHTQSAQ